MTVPYIDLHYFLHRNKGQNVVEYAVLLAFIGLLVIAAALLLGPQISAVFSRIASLLGGV